MTAASNIFYSFQALQVTSRPVFARGIPSISLRICENQDLSKASIEGRNRWVWMGAQTSNPVKRTQMRPEGYLDNGNIRMSSCSQARRGLFKPASLECLHLLPARWVIAQRLPDTKRLRY